LPIAYCQFVERERLQPVRVVATSRLAIRDFVSLELRIKQEKSQSKTQQQKLTTNRQLAIGNNASLI
jgi:hypothetical protein